MARLAAEQLEAEVRVVDALNVFPVPDGDTGTNMLATLGEALRQAGDFTGVGQVADSLAQGALMGARGNSGVLLSQLFRAQREVLAGRGTSHPLAASDLAAILARTRDLAYGALANPMPGTMLSVLEAAASAAGDAQAPGVAAGELLKVVLAAAEAAVAATPQQLPVLREAGVVDSGGYGLLLVLRGWYEALADEPAPRGEVELMGLERARERAATGTGHPGELLGAPAGGYGYCVTLLVDTAQADESVVRQGLLALGDSPLVVADEGRLKLHVHVADPALAVDFAAALGTVIASEVSNIDEQTGSAASLALPVVAVVSGEGLTRIFRGLGASTVGGGQSHNPSTAELIAGCEGLAGTVFLLPNNSNVLAAADQAATIRHGLLVVPTRSVPEGVAAALAYDGGAGPEENLARMTRAAESVLSAELVPAVREATVNGVHIGAGETMVLLDGKLLGAGQPGLAALANRVSQASCELATIYYGASASGADAGELREQLGRALSDLEIEIVRGDQPRETFIIGFE